METLLHEDAGISVNRLMQKKLEDFNIPAVAQGSKNRPACLALPRQEYPAT